MVLVHESAQNFWDSIETSKIMDLSSGFKPLLFKNSKAKKQKKH